jgi:hypothetical protein
MTKRPSIIAGMDLTPPASAQAGKGVEIAASQPVPAKSRPRRFDVQYASVHIPRAAYERLREIAFAAFVVMTTGVLRLCAIAFLRTVSISLRPERELPSPRRPSLAPLRGLRPRARKHRATPAKRERVLIVAGIRKRATERRQSGVGCLRCAL